MSSSQLVEDIEKFLELCEDYGSDGEDFGSTVNEENVDMEDEEEHDSEGTSEEEEEDIFDSDDEDNIPLNLLRKKIGIIEFTKIVLRGKNKHKWSSKKGKSHRYGMNVVHQARGPTRECKNITEPLKCFQLFITDDILSEVVQWTNAEINVRKKDLVSSTAQTRETDLDETKALVGVLCLTAVSKSNHLTSDELFDCSYSGSRYVSIMTKARFKFLLSCLRFDDKAVRLRICNDKFASIRKIWDMFIQKCRQNYTPGSYLTIDEQLLAFRGKCSFRMYIPNKPAKYGLKTIMMCDSGTKYMVDAMPYLGKGSNTGDLPLAAKHDGAQDLEILQSELNQHHAMKDLAYEIKKEGKMLAKRNPEMKVYAFDLQQCLPTPFL
ncbi:piggyBac transposable element-derived protein 4-like [Episyrphus balteatus]|uniref:piggyBac transposable element-derived protein 4-like n=1 Tax=Episyrphus balteatus TaxID=286459 RepID=UPI002485F96A|nr:piggyBac transposable element-derived protein 4-like [Episyrphus balteatus]